jgi:transposase, IS5 family
MVNQRSFASLDCAAKKKRTKRDVFLAEMGRIVPWSRLEAVIAPHYPMTGPQGERRAFPVAVMLRIYCLQQWLHVWATPGLQEDSDVPPAVGCSHVSGLLVRRHAGRAIQRFLRLP